jgi:predicted Zn-dependent protease
MPIRAARLVFGSVLLTAAPAVAADPTAPSTATATATQSVRRDPAGRTGISPSWEAIKRGDVAYVAHDIEGAIKEYQAAIEAHPQNPVGHYRLACVLIGKREYKQAQESLDAALRFSKSDPFTAGKTLFVMADLMERQQDYPAALAAWKAYSIFAATHKEAKVFPSTAESRLSRLAAYVKLTEQSEQVKQRIAERLQNSEFRDPQGAKGSKHEDSKR